MTSFFSKVAALWQKPDTKSGGIDAKRQGSFALMQGEMDGHLLIATIDLSLAEYPTKAACPWFLSISTPLINPTSDGLPTSTDNSALNAWEDLLESAITGEGRFVHVGHVTWNGSREVLYYLEEPEPAVARLKKLLDKDAARPFAFRCERDENWDRVSVYLTKKP